MRGPDAMRMHMQVPDRHLDLGCGKFPRNPYRRAAVCGVDIRALSAPADFELRTANLAVEPIPYEDSSFGSVSAFDFLEHVPRLLPTPDGRGTVFPFIRLMDEIWRVLAPGGRLYALTPAYPHADAFKDPTHVNIVTDGTHEYFCGANPPGRMYGFAGRFDVVRVERVWVDQHYEARTPAPRPGGLRGIAHALRDRLRALRGRDPAAALPYLLWELEAVKLD